MRSRKIPLAKLEPSSGRRNLHDTSVRRIENLAAIFQEVDPRPEKCWVKDFEQDANPEKEIQLWEGMAATFMLFQRNGPVSLAGRRQALQILLFRTLADRQTVRAQIALRHLAPSETRTLLDLYDQVGCLPTATD